MENKHKHLEFIQGVIGRMAGNLFFLRGWTITLIAAMLTFSTKEFLPPYLKYFYITLILMFWIMDGYFLSQERLYRDLYDDVRKRKSNETDFSMDTSKYKKYVKNTQIFAMCSPSLLIFYVPLILAAILILF